MHVTPALVRLATEDSGSLITIGGLPMHPLAVHAVVVLLPLSILGLMAVVLVPKWRAAYSKLVIAGLAISVGATWVAVQAGEQLALITGITQEHARYGKLLEVVAVLLFMVAAAWWWPIRNERHARSALGTGTQSLTSLGSLILSVATLILVAMVGHSGASAVWSARLAAAQSTPTPAASATTTASASKTGYTMAKVKKHNRPSDCWTVVDKTVYNVTSWIDQHPGGPMVIQSMCGVDATSAFTMQHGGQGGPADALSSFKLGPLAG